MGAQSGFIVVDRDEDGELITFEMEVDSANVALEIQFKGDAGTRMTFCDDTMNQLLRKGRGLTPGDVEQVSSDRSKDPVGTPLHNLVYLGRFKNEEFSDYIEDSRRTIVARFDPVQPWAYGGIVIKIKNYNLLETGIKRVRSILLVRHVYGDFEEIQGQELHPEDLAKPNEEDEGFLPIDLEELESELDVEDTQEEDIEYNTTGVQKIKEMEEEEEGPPVTDERPGFMKT